MTDLAAILGILAFILFVRFTLMVTWTIIKVLAGLIVYGILFVMITAVFGFVWLSPVLFVAGVAWLIGHTILKI